VSLAKVDDDPHAERSEIDPKQNINLIQQAQKMAWGP